MKFVAIVDTTFNAARSKCIKDRRHPIEEGIGFLIGFDAAVEYLNSTIPHGIQDGLGRAMVRLGAHQYTNFFKSLPFSVEGEKCANLEVPGGDVERPGYASPVFEVAQSSPAGHTVINDKEVTTPSLIHHISLRIELARGERRNGWSGRDAA